MLSMQSFKQNKIFYKVISNKTLLLNDIQAKFSIITIL